MSDTHERPSTLRMGHGHESGKVGFVELFFDLVYVFAITMLSHSLLHHFTGIGLAETAFLLVAIWWVWVYTTWAMNWLNPAATAVRLMLAVSPLQGPMCSCRSAGRCSRPGPCGRIPVISAISYAFRFG